MPGGAGLVLMPLYASFEWGDWIIRSPYIAAAWTALIAFLMVSTLPTLSLKKFSIPHRYVMPLLLGIGLVAAFLTTAPFPTLFLIGFIYIGSIPLTIRAAWRSRRAGQALKPEPAEAAALPAPPPVAVLGEANPPPNEWRH